MEAGVLQKTFTRRPKRKSLSLDPEPSVRLFVYGTLMPGRSNHWQISAHVREAQPGMITGMLVDLGAFPALVPGEGLVKGVVLDIHRSALTVSDRIEGYDPDQQQRCLYLRKAVAVQLLSLIHI